MNQMRIKIKLICAYSLLAFLLASLSPVLAQQPATVSVSGTAYDPAGIALPGVTIYVKNKISIGTSSDMNGKFSIRTQVGETLVFAFVSFQKVEYTVTGEKQNVEIRFTDEALALEEVVVSSFGTSQRKISSVAAVTTVDVKELQNPATPSMSNLLGGRVAGVITMQTSGEPGKNIAEFWIRGIGTFGANASALVLIDGLEGDLNSIDPADVESFSVLKDASATAVYGVRGANGVVLITTKKGQAGKLNITGRVNYSMSHLKRLPQYLRAYDYAKLVNEALEVRGDYPLYDNIDLDVIRYGTDPDLFPDVSWQDEILRKNSLRQSYYLSAQGGAEVAKYFVSLGGSKEDAAYNYDKNNVYAANAGYNTYSYRANIDLQLSPSATVFLGADGFLAITNNPGVANTDYIWDAQALLNPLLLPVRYSNGQAPALAGGDELVSPEVMINQYGRRSNQEYRGKVTLAYNQDLGMFLEGLKFRVQGAYDLTSWFEEQRYVHPALYAAETRDSYGRLVTKLTRSEQKAAYGRNTDQYRKFHLEGTLNYDRVFAENHRVGGLIYYYMSDQKKASDGYSNLSAIPKRYMGVSSRLTYGYKDTYMIDFNFGYTGSENFQPGKQFGFFPSVALGWVPTSYDYVRENMPWADMFKIRFSYGTVGNDRLAGTTRFPYLSTVMHGSGRPWDSLSSTEIIMESTIGADNLAWEKAVKSDLGIEGQFFGNKLSFTIDFFNDLRDGIFMPRVQVPDYAGLWNLPYGNVGKMRSYGSDGNASYMFEIKKNVMSFTLRGNFTYSKNSVENWEEANPKYPYQERSDYPHDPQRGFQSLGLFKDDLDIATSATQTAYGKVMPGDIKYRDINGDGKIDSDDRIPLSFSSYPLLMYGFGGQFQYKALTVGVLFKGTGKTDYFNTGQYVEIKGRGTYNGPGYIPFYQGRLGNVLTIANDPANRWIPKEYAEMHGISAAQAENPNARFPRLQYGNNSNNSQLSDFWKGDARYLRLQEITINYNLRTDFLRRAGIASIDLQLVGNNLYVWDKVKLFDPEQAWFGGRVYPIPASFAFQLYINL